MKSLNVRVYKTTEQLNHIKILSLCYDFENITDYYSWLIERGLESDAEKYNRAAAEHNERLQAERQTAGISDFEAVQAKLASGQLSDIEAEALGASIQAELEGK